MKVGQLLENIRDSYLKQFRQRISEVELTGMKAIVEGAYRDEHGALVGDGALGLPLRADIVAIANGEVTESFHVNSDSMLSFETINFDWNGLPTQLTPFHWDSCQVRATSIRMDGDWSRLRDWFDYWFDGEDSRQPDNRGFSGVIHFLSDPQQNGAMITFEVDFGSAPVEAFEGLLDALCDLGATKIEIGYGQAAARSVGNE